MLQAVIIPDPGQIMNSRRPPQQQLFYKKIEHIIAGTAPQQIELSNIKET